MNRSLVCPGCGHGAAGHDGELGCIVGWAYDGDGCATVLGCDCPWTIASAR